MQKGHSASEAGVVTHGGLEKAFWEQASELFLNLKPHAAYAASHSAANCVGAGTSTLM